MARWVYRFQSTGFRDLTDDERATFTRRVGTLFIQTMSLGILSVVFFVLTIFAISAAAGGQQVAWIAIIAGTLLGGYSLSSANGRERLALLHRRALRLGRVERFERMEGDLTTHRGWHAGKRINSTAEDDGEEAPLNPYWSEEEKFEETLRKVSGSAAAWFESVDRDGVPILIEGKPIRKILEPPVWDTEHRVPPGGFQ